MPDITYDLQSNTQLTHDSLRIGSASIRPREYVDGAGVTQRGLTAGLWIYYREDSGQDRTAWVHPGQALIVAGYQIDVLDINLDGPGTVKLRVRSPQAQPAYTQA